MQDKTHVWVRVAAGLGTGFCVVFLWNLWGRTDADWTTAAFAAVVATFLPSLWVGLSIGLWTLLNRCLRNVTDWANAGVCLVGAIAMFALLPLLHAVPIDKNTVIFFWAIPFSVVVATGVPAFFKAMIAHGAGPEIDADGWSVFGFSTGTIWLIGGVIAAFVGLLGFMAIENPSRLSASITILFMILAVWSVMVLKRPQLVLRGTEIWIRSWWHGWRSFDLSQLSGIRELPLDEYLGWELTFYSASTVRVSKSLQRSEALIEELSQHLQNRV